MRAPRSTTGDSDWIADACAGLMGARGAAVGWGYRAGAAPFVEPTVLTSLALLAAAPEEQGPAATALARRSAQWLAECQSASGAVGLTASLANPAWPTPYAILLWSAMGGFEDPIRRAVAWLLDSKGKSYTQSTDSPVGHDTTLVGWPWVQETHSWVEPTALAVMALVCAGFADHQRCQQGFRLLCDRAIATGGWNYGNSMMFGKSLRPQPGPTGLALVALAGYAGATNAAQRAAIYLENCLPGVRAEQSLGLGLLGLAAWSRPAGAAEQWLAEAYQKSAGRSGSTWLLAYLLLAARSTKTLALLGVPQPLRS